MWRTWDGLFVAPPEAQHRRWKDCTGCVLPELWRCYWPTGGRTIGGGGMSRYGECLLNCEGVMDSELRLDSRRDRNFPCYFCILCHCCVKCSNNMGNSKYNSCLQRVDIALGTYFASRLSQKTSSCLIHDHYIEKYHRRSLTITLMARSCLIQGHARASLTVS